MVETGKQNNIKFPLNYCLASTIAAEELFGESHQQMIALAGKLIADVCFWDKRNKKKNGQKSKLKKDKSSMLSLLFKWVA